MAQSRSRETRVAAAASKVAERPASAGRSLASRPFRSPLSLPDPFRARLDVGKSSASCPTCDAQVTPSAGECPSCGSVAQARALPLARPSALSQLKADSSLARPGAVTADPKLDAAEVQADLVGGRIARNLESTEGIRPGSLPGSVRGVAEKHLGVGLEGTQLHADAEAERRTKASGALALTEGSDIHFARGRLSLSSPAGRHVLGHELTHVAQQKAHGFVARQPIISTPEQIGLPTSEERARGDAAMDRYLAEQKEHEKGTAGVVGGLTDEEVKKRERREVLADLERLVRLRAIGIMGAHRGQIKGARDKVVQESKQPLAPGASGEKKSAGDQSKPPSALDDTRQAAKMVADLRKEEGLLTSSRSSLQDANRNARGQGDINDIIASMTAPENMRHVPAKLLRAIGEGGAAAARSGNGILWAIGSTYALIDLRQRQLFGIEQAVSRLHEAFPVLSELDPELVNPERRSQAVSDPMSGQIVQESRPLGEAGDDELRREIDRGYAAIMGKVDNAIAAIAKGDISPYDMPVALQAASASAKPEAFQILKEEAEHREHQKFWLQMGLTLVEATLVFIPVVGPLIAGAAAVANFGLALSDLNELLAKRAVAEASTNPYSSPLGVQRVSNFEVAVLGIGAILSAFEAGSVFQAIRTGKVSAELGSLLDQVDALRSGGKTEELAETLSAAGREQRLAQSGKRASTAMTDAEAQVELIDVLDSGLAKGKPGRRKAPLGDHEWREEGFGRWCRFSNDKKCIEIPGAEATRADAAGTSPGAYSVSPERARHILEGTPVHPGSAPGHGHGPGRALPIGAFPDTWTDEQVIAAIERVANSPNSSWMVTKGPEVGKLSRGGPAPGAATTTRTGNAVRYSVRGQDHGLNIEVIVEPGGEGIITGYNRGK